jgi:hypothetical protein
MRSLRSFLLIAGIAFLLPSCEFNCSIGDKKEEEVKGAAVVKDGARIYNNIELSSPGIKIGKAYLVLENGERVPDDNFTDFKNPVKMELVIDSGWVEQNGRVFLGASEKIVAENGTVVVDEQDLFKKYEDGVSAADAKALYLSASVKLKEGAAPTSFTVSFRIWDKKGNGYIEGNYKLYSK